MYDKYKKLRDERGLTDYRVSKDAQVPYSTLRDWSNGIYQPKVDKITKLANYFGVSLDYFYKEA